LSITRQQIIDIFESIRDNSIVEYLWLNTDAAPTPAATDRALGTEIDVVAHTKTEKYWNGTAWVNLV